MSKLRCTCGHLIIDQTDNLDYKGYIIPDVEVDNISDVLTKSIDELADAKTTTDRIEWIKKNFIVPPYPVDLKDSSMIHDIISNKLIDTMLRIYECINCGRIAIQQGQTNQFSFFKPESSDSRSILNGKT